MRMATQPPAGGSATWGDLIAQRARGVADSVARTIAYPAITPNLLTVVGFLLTCGVALLIGNGYERVGELLGGDLRSTTLTPFAPWLGKGLGRNAEALDTLRKALVILEPLLATRPENQQYRIHLATLYSNIGTLEPDGASAVVWMQKAIDVAREITPLKGQSQEQSTTQKQRLLLGLGEAQLRAGNGLGNVPDIRLGKVRELEQGRLDKQSSVALEVAELEFVRGNFDGGKFCQRHAECLEIGLHTAREYRDLDLRAHRASFLLGQALAKQ